MPHPLHFIETERRQKKSPYNLAAFSAGRAQEDASAHCKCFRWGNVFLTLGIRLPQPQAHHALRNNDLAPSKHRVPHPELSIKAVFA